MSTQYAATSLDIALGTAVICRDGPHGRVTRLVVAPYDRQVTHVIMRYGIPHREVVVPIEQVAQQQDGSLLVTLSRDAFARLPRFAEVDYIRSEPPQPPHLTYPPQAIVFNLRGYSPRGVSPSDVWSDQIVSRHTLIGMPSDEIPIGRGTHVTSRAGEEGRLDHVLLDPRTDCVQALVVHKGRLPGKDVTIPGNLVKWIAEEEIRIDADYLTQEAIPTPGQPLSDGAMESRSHEAHSEGITQATAPETAVLPGIREPRPELPADADVARTVTEALAHDSRTAQANIEATYGSGCLTLRGQVRTALEKEAAVEVAEAAPEVAAVIDELEVCADAEEWNDPEPSFNKLLALGVGAGTMRRL